FFQAEDGIRGLIVTGVQTCALPISARARPRGERGGCDRRRARAQAVRRPRGSPAGGLRAGLPARGPRRARPAVRRSGRGDRRREIGRASCRERVAVAVAEAALTYLT